MRLTHRPGGPYSVHGGRAVGSESALAVTAIWVTETPEVRAVVADLIALCVVMIFPVSHYTGTQGDSTPGNTSDSPVTPHACANTHYAHAYMLTQGKGNVVTTALNQGVKGYPY